MPPAFQCAECSSRASGVLIPEDERDAHEAWHEAWQLTGDLIRATAAYALSPVSAGDHVGRSAAVDEAERAIVRKITEGRMPHNS